MKRSFEKIAIVTRGEAAGRLIRANRAPYTNLNLASC